MQIMQYNKMLKQAVSSTSVDYFPAFILKVTKHSSFKNIFPSSEIYHTLVCFAKRTPHSEEWSVILMSFNTLLF